MLILEFFVGEGGEENIYNVGWVTRTACRYRIRRAVCGEPRMLEINEKLSLGETCEAVPGETIVLRKFVFYRVSSDWKDVKM